MPDEYLPPNKILFLQNLPETVTKDQLNGLFSQYPNLHEVRLVPSKKDIAFVEYLDEGSATVAKDALHNYKLDGENKIKVRAFTQPPPRPTISTVFPDHIRQEIGTWGPRVSSRHWLGIYNSSALPIGAYFMYPPKTLSGVSRMLVMRIITHSLNISTQ